jgi:DNA-binding response OmpR family regulator
MGRPRVLLVEDHDDLRRLFATALTLAGFTVRQATDGLEALRAIDVDPPDIVVLDLILPVVDGFAVRREMEEHAHTRGIPVVVVTAIPQHDLQSFNAACTLTKPVMPADLVAAVRRCLARGTPARA